MKLYETNSRRPSQYAVIARYGKHEKTTSETKTRIIAPIGSPFYVAFGAFRRTFQHLTGVEWDFRSWASAIPVHMHAQASLRHEGERIEGLTADQTPRVELAIADFLNGDDSNVQTPTTPPLKGAASHYPTPPSSTGFLATSDASISGDPQTSKSATGIRYQYRLPMPSQGEPRGMSFNVITLNSSSTLQGASLALEHVFSSSFIFECSPLELTADSSIQAWKIWLRRAMSGTAMHVQAKRGLEGFRVL